MMWRGIDIWSEMAIRSVVLWRVWLCDLVDDYCRDNIIFFSFCSVYFGVTLKGLLKELERKPVLELTPSL